MIRVAFPPPAFQVKTSGGRELIFDALRKQWVRLTPEEWVRQNFVQYLIQVKLYPAALIGVEKEIRLGELKKRFDLLVFDTHHQPWMLVECKAMKVPLDETVLQQVLRYHSAVEVPFLVLTNGANTYGWSKTAGRLLPLQELPAFGSGS
ncbi:MAG TPA: type I restriction enzyme HsdR N-terminal domain-containing protein [Lacibacter sp.]|nr:type I restriction enzyme HsdR N-terminal domain-containing protein [Lacibacter sp.]HMO87535.1 type I restriction enzyme HsdR N-terminal domain-containing protein [Lacibacter sp.]